MLDTLGRITLNTSIFHLIGPTSTRSKLSSLATARKRRRFCSLVSTNLKKSNPSNKSLVLSCGVASRVASAPLRALCPHSYSTRMTKESRVDRDAGGRRTEINASKISCSFMGRSRVGVSRRLNAATSRESLLETARQHALNLAKIRGEPVFSPSQPPSKQPTIVGSRDNFLTRRPRTPSFTTGPSLAVLPSFALYDRHFLHPRLFSTVLKLYPSFHFLSPPTPSIHRLLCAIGLRAFQVYR